jgi:hypothetical protein
MDSKHMQNMMYVFGNAKKLSVQEDQVMKDNLPHFAEIMRQRGKITEAEMDAKGIPNYNNFDSDRKPKDQRALHKQRAAVMNADDVVAQFIDYQRQRAAHIANREARQKLREDTADERQAAKAAKEAEKRRRSLLSPDEKREEANAKRRATIARKREEQLQRHEQIEDEAVGGHISDDNSADDELGDGDFDLDARLQAIADLHANNQNNDDDDFDFEDNEFEI